jgi:hypothetical protein
VRWRSFGLATASNLFMAFGRGLMEPDDWKNLGMDKVETEPVGETSGVGSTRGGDS